MTSGFPSVQAAGLTLRPATPADAPFLAELYASTRADEVAAFGWPPELQRAFLSQQHGAREAGYAQQYPEADNSIIERAGQPIGRLYLSTSDQELLLIDIALMPKARDHGLGSALLHKVIALASAQDRPVSLHVEKTNPARRLYQRLGFEVVEDQSVYDRMVRQPGPVSDQ